MLPNAQDEEINRAITDCDYDEDRLNAWVSTEIDSLTNWEKVDRTKRKPKGPTPSRGGAPEPDAPSQEWASKDEKSQPSKRRDNTQGRGRGRGDGLRGRGRGRGRGSGRGSESRREGEQEHEQGTSTNWGQAAASSEDWGKSSSEAWGTQPATEASSSWDAQPVEEAQPPKKPAKSDWLNAASKNVKTSPTPQWGTPVESVPKAAAPTQAPTAVKVSGAWAAGAPKPRSVPPPEKSVPASVTVPAPHSSSWETAAPAAVSTSAAAEWDQPEPIRTSTSDWGTAAKESPRNNNVASGWDTSDDVQGSWDKAMASPPLSPNPKQTAAQDYASSSSNVYYAPTTQQPPSREIEEPKPIESLFAQAQSEYDNPTMLLWTPGNRPTPIPSTGLGKHSADKTASPVTLPSHLERLNIQDPPVSFGSFDARPHPDSQSEQSKPAEAWGQDPGYHNGASQEWISGQSKSSHSTSRPTEDGKAGTPHSQPAPSPQPTSSSSQNGGSASNEGHGSTPSTQGKSFPAHHMSRPSQMPHTPQGMVPFYVSPTPHYVQYLPYSYPPNYQTYVPPYGYTRGQPFKGQGQYPQPSAYPNQPFVAAAGATFPYDATMEDGQGGMYSMYPLNPDGRLHGPAPTSSGKSGNSAQHQAEYSQPYNYQMSAGPVPTHGYGYRQTQQFHQPPQ